MWSSLWHEILQYASPIAAVAAALSAVAAALGLFWDARATRRQTNAQIMMEYTRRYMEIVAGCPDEWYERFAEPPPARDPRLTRALHLYLDLECQEMYLRREGHFSERVWVLWESLLVETLRSPFFQREWPVLRREFIYDPAFVAYVEERMKQRPAQATAAAGASGA